MFRHLLVVFQLDTFLFTLLCILVEVAWHFALIPVFVQRDVGGFLSFWLEVEDRFVEVVADVVLSLSFLKSQDVISFWNSRFPDLLL